jgi:hypothetical protein
MSIDVREHATRIILDHARDVEYLSISEATEDLELSPEAHEDLCRRIDGAIGTATVDVSWPSRAELAAEGRRLAEAVNELTAAAPTDLEIRAQALDSAARLLGPGLAEILGEAPYEVVMQAAIEEWERATHAARQYIETGSFHGTIGLKLGAEGLAQRFHETYERLASSFGYVTREASAKPWADVPEQNRALMTAVCAEILGSPAGAKPDATEFDGS